MIGSPSWPSTSRSLRVGDAVRPVNRVSWCVDSATDRSLTTWRRSPSLAGTAKPGTSGRRRTVRSVRRIFSSRAWPAKATCPITLGGAFVAAQRSSPPEGRPLTHRGAVHNSTLGAVRLRAFTCGRQPRPEDDGAETWDKRVTQSGAPTHGAGWPRAAHLRPSPRRMAAEPATETQAPQDERRRRS